MTPSQIHQPITSVRNLLRIRYIDLEPNLDLFSGLDAFKLSKNLQGSSKSSTKSRHWKFDPILDPMSCHTTFLSQVFQRLSFRRQVGFFSQHAEWYRDAASNKRKEKFNALVVCRKIYRKPSLFTSNISNNRRFQ